MEPDSTEPDDDMRLLRREDLPLSLHQIHGYEHGWAARIVPMKAGYRVGYYSTTHLEDEVGTDFPTPQEALKAVEELLPVANSAEERAKAKDMEELLWLMLRHEANEGTL